MKKKVIIISCGPGLEDVRNEYGHSYQWVQDACNLPCIDFYQSNAYKGEFQNLQDGDGWIITGSAKSAYDDIEWII